MSTPYVKTDVRRRQVVAAARAVLGRDGMSGGTLRAVAAEAGVPLGTVHYVFPSKEQLLRAVLEDVIEEISQAFQASAGDPTDLESAMRSSAQQVFSQLVEADTGGQVMQYELTMWALRTPGMADIARQQYQLYIDLITANWTSAATRAGVTLAVPVEQLARLFLAGADGLILQYLTTRDTDRAKADLDLLVVQMLRYAAPQPDDDRVEQVPGLRQSAGRRHSAQREGAVSPLVDGHQ